MYFYIPAITIIALLLLSFLLIIISFVITFKSSKPKKKRKEEFEMPPGKIYLPYKEQLIEWMKQYRSLPQEDFYITSYDGLKLHGKYFEFVKGAPIEIMFHGYRGNAERDLCGGVERCKRANINVLVVDQRAHGESEGKAITFGIKERFDCKSWVDFAVKHFGDDVVLYITGISMGASTVLMASSLDLPSNVKGIVADCGFSSPKEIIKETVKKMHLPPKLMYPFIKFGAKVFGKFNIEETSPLEELKKCKIPVIFFHGDTDNFVPHYMSQDNFEACASEKKKIIITPNAGHGLCFMLDMDGYIKELQEFLYVLK